MKRIQKGFTLIELIIVLAIFSIILALVMSFIDPVAKIMKKASVRERTAAYVDNIGEYLDKSLRYAQVLRVYNGGFCDSDDPSEPRTEKEAVEQLVSKCLNGAVDYKGDPLKGKVRVLKLINTPTTDCPVEGQIYESVYNFTAGAIVEVTHLDGTTEEVEKLELDVQPDLQQNLAIVNDEHFEEYCYYYNTGFFTLNNLIDPDNFSSLVAGETKSYAPNNRSYYSTLYPIMYDSDNDGTLDERLTISKDPQKENLCVNVVAYQKDGETDNKEIVHYTADDGSEKDVTVFKSPAHLTATSMSLVNVIASHDINTAAYVQLVRKTEDGEPDKYDDGSYKFETVPTFHVPYAIYDASYSDVTDNIYFVFIIPDEIFDTELVYN